MICKPLIIMNDINIIHCDDRWMNSKPDKKIMKLNCFACSLQINFIMFCSCFEFIYQSLQGTKLISFTMTNSIQIIVIMIIV